MVMAMVSSMLESAGSRWEECRGEGWSSVEPRITNLETLEWRVAAAGGKRTAAAGRLLFATHRGDDQVLDGIAGGFVPLLGERAAARPRRECRGGIRDGFLRVAH